MSEAGGRPESALISLVASGASGAFEVKDGRKRWIFYLNGGALVFTRSNLKSESAEAIRDELVSPTRAGIIHAQAVRRLRNAFRGAPTHSFRDGESSSKTLPIPTRAVLLDGIAQARDESALRDLATELLESWPRLVGSAPVELGGDELLEGYLNTLDGERPGEDVLSFAPGGDLRRALTAMWMSWKLGSIEAGEEPAAEAPAGGLGLDLGFDLDAVLAEATAAPAAAADPGPIVPSSEPIRPPAVAEEDAPTVDLDATEALASAPEPAPEVSEPEVSEPEVSEPEVPQGHPMEERLRSLADRVNLAETHFDMLGLPWDSPVNDFSAAYRDLARDLHPDRYVDASDELQDLATEVFDKVRAAFEVIGNEEAREKYTDKVIHGKKTEEELAMEQLQAYWAGEADFKKGLAAFNQGKLNDAHEFFTRAVDAVPDELEFRAYHAYTSFNAIRNRDPEKALDYIDTLKAVIERNQEQERKLDAAWVLLGRAYRELGEADKAKRCLVQALRINAANSDATREMRRLTNPERKPKKEEKKGGFFSKLFGKK